MAHTMIEGSTLAPPAGEPVSQEPPRPPARRWTAGAGVRAPEIGVAVAALVLNAWSLSQNGLGNAYYAASVRSMTTSWHAFLYGSYDVGGFITTDKPPLAQWVMAASAKVFGYSAWSLLLPSAVAGALSVWLLTITVRRVWGRTAGIVAGVALALTPMMFAVSRSSNPDAILVLMLVASVWATERAVATGRWRWSAAAGAFVGLGFLAKMLAAAIVLPAIAMALAVGLARRADGTIGRELVRRIGHVAAVGLAFVAVSFSWVALIDLSSDAPYVGGSDDGTAWNLVWGYNGFGRVFGSSGPGGNGGPSGQAPGGFGAVANVVQQFGGDPGVGRLFNFSIGDQVMWLAVIAGAALAAGTVVAIRRRRLDGRAGSVTLFGTWALTGYALFSFSSGIFHNYYVSAMAPALAALVGIGVAHVIEGGRMAKLVAAAAVLANAGLQMVFLLRIDAFEWLRIVVPVVSVALAGALVLWAMRPSLDRRRWAILSAGLGACLVAPAMWIGSGLTHAQNGSFPDARPAEAGEGAFGPGAAPAGAGALDTDALDELTAMTTTETWILAVDSSQQASTAIIEGYPLLSMGGFSGGDAAMTGERLAELVRSGELRFVAGSGIGGGRAGGGPGGRGTGASTWAAAVCEPVTLASGSSLTVYDCEGKADELLQASQSSTDPAVPGGQGVPGGAVPGGGALPGDGAGPAGPPPQSLLECLADQGIDDPPTLPDGRPDLSDPATRAAVEECLGRDLP